MEIASEYRYRDSVPDPKTLVVTITQSGETADTLAALRHLLDARRSITANLGTGQGYSVLDVVHAYEQASGRRVACHAV